MQLRPPMQFPALPAPVQLPARVQLPVVAARHRVIPLPPPVPVPILPVIALPLPAPVQVPVLPLPGPALLAQAQGPAPDGDYDDDDNDGDMTQRRRRRSELELLTNGLQTPDLDRSLRSLRQPERLQLAQSTPRRVGHVNRQCRDCKTRLHNLFKNANLI